MQYSSSPPARHRHPARALLLTALLSVTSACQDRTPVVVTRFTAFATQVDINLVGVSREQAPQVAAAIRVNRLLASGETFVPPPSMLPLLASCRTLESRSEGFFNPASGRLSALWGRDRGQPPADQIARLVAAHPSLTQIEQQGLELRGTNPALALDFSRVAAGYAIDIATQHLLDLGIRNALVQVDGALRVLGDRSGQPWRLPILRASGSGVHAILAVRNREGVATVAEHDRLYHAIIDPQTGSPSGASRAVTVVHQDTLTATAAAMALFSAGPDDWERIAGKMGIRYVLMFDRAGGIHMSPAMAGRIEPVDAQDGDSPAGSTPEARGRGEGGP